jgi:hypothetical protein
MRLIRPVVCAVALSCTLPAVARADGSDSPWPRRGGEQAQLRAVRQVVDDLDEQLGLLQLEADRYRSWRECLKPVPVSEYGDPDRQSGFHYDEGDGAGPSFMPALAVDRRSRDGAEDYIFFDFRRAGGCESAAPPPGGIPDPSPMRHDAGFRPAAAHAVGLRALEQRMPQLRRQIRVLTAVVRRFDAWESCVSWVPVTQLGDPAGRYGYRFGPGSAAPPVFSPALSIDRSDWDDPDYMFLAYVGGDRPGKHCQNEPGEGVD